MKDDEVMDIENLKEALRYLREYYMSAKLCNIPVLYGLDSLNSVIMKLQVDLDKIETAKER